MRRLQPARLAIAGLATFVIVALAYGTLSRSPTHGERSSAHSDPYQHAREQRMQEISVRFNQAIVMLHAKQYEHAVTALHRVLELVPRMPEAHVNMGYALLGMRRFDAARDFFKVAVELRPGQANAYYGLALAAEGRKDLETALGAMRAYIHLSRSADPHRRRARAAIWEWEESLGRHGPSTSAESPGRTGTADDPGDMAISLGSDAAPGR